MDFLLTVPPENVFPTAQEHKDFLQMIRPTNVSVNGQLDFMGKLKTGHVLMPVPPILTAIDSKLLVFVLNNVLLLTLLL